MESLVSTMMAALAGMGIFLGVIVVFLIACNWKIYTKAGKPGWACIVPIYNIIVILQIIKKPVWWFILLLIPIVNFIILLIMQIQLAKVFGKGVGFGLGLIFLSPIFLPILAFGSAEYQSDANAVSGEK
jgi:hypothetical protein